MKEEEKVVQKTARWKAVSYSTNTGYTIYCSCGYMICNLDKKTNPAVCSRCGARMENSRHKPDNWVQARDSYFARKKSREAREAQIINQINKA